MTDTNLLLMMMALIDDYEKDDNENLDDDLGNDDGFDTGEHLPDVNCCNGCDRGQMHCFIVKRRN